VLGCAEALGFLGIRPEDITWISTVDTDSGMRDCVQTDSAVSFLQSEVLAVAAEQLRQKLLDLAAPVLGVPAGQMTVSGGQILAPGRSLSVKELLWKGDLVPLSVMVSRRPSGQKTGVPFIASFAEVEVDIGTGRIQVLKLVIVNDCGTVMHASGAEAQQIGGQVMALGEALTEELIYDPVRGVPLNFNLIDYKMPTILDMPSIEPVLLEVWRGAGEYGACGIGEGTLTCTPRAVANAVYNAIGARVDELPLTPEKVLRALGKI
jgi:CO/xanthine dehydrogenase Mo-binding subunit